MQSIELLKEQVKTAQANLEERAKALFNSEYVSEEINNSNRVKWAESVNSLGSKWLYHKSNMVKRKGVK